MRLSLLFISSLIGSFAFGHGEGKAGPNKGYIRMPGAFHTEVVPTGLDGFRVHLLDINWKNSSVENSALEINLEVNKESKVVSCRRAERYYICELPKGFSLKKGKLILKSSREGLVGNEVSYDLPLSFKGHQGGH